MSQGRKGAVQAARQREEELNLLFQTWDMDRSGGLKWSELSRCLKDIARQQGKENYEPADEDIKWMIKKSVK